MFKKIIDKFNNMQPRQLLILAGVAACLMFIAIFLGVNLMSQQPVVITQNTPPPEPEKKIQVVVAAKNMSSGTRIQDSMIQMKEFPEDIVPKDAITSFDAVKNVQIHAPIYSGDIITLQKLNAVSEDESFASSIPANCRAVSINVNDVTGVAGFAKPGDHVDLLLVEKGQHSATTTLLLQDVPILSINQNSTRSAPVGENGVPTSVAVNPSIATFALVPEDALKLTAAAKIGDIYLSLRPATPRNVYVEEMEYTVESVNKPAPPVVQTPTPVIPNNSPLPQVPAVPATPKIEIIAGDQIVQSNSPNVQIVSGTPTTQPKTATPAQPPAGGPINSQPLPVIPSSGFNPEYLPPIPSIPVPSPPIVNP